MAKKIITIVTILLIMTGIGVVLANNKAKIDKAANPEKKIAVIPVKVHEVSEDSFNIAFTLNGTTIPSKEVKLASEVQGKLVGLYIDNGDVVSAGQVIATLDASVYSAQLNSISTAIAKANLDMARYQRLVEMGGATQMQIESTKLQIQSLYADRQQVLDQISHMQIRAPFSGRIENVKVENGSFVTYGTILSDLLDNSSLKINVFLSEQEAFRVKPSQPVLISSPVLSAPKKGRISMISDKADASGKFLAEIQFSNNDKEKLKAGIIADVEFTFDEVTTGLSIPASALLGSAKQAKVFVVNGGHVEQRSVVVGIITPNKLHVIEGLKTGEKVVTSGQVNLVNGTPISIIQ